MITVNNNTKHETIITPIIATSMTKASIDVLVERWPKAVKRWLILHKTNLIMTHSLTPFLAALSFITTSTQNNYTFMYYNYVNPKSKVCDHLPKL